MRRTFARYLPFVLGAAVLAGCAARVPHVADLKTDPTRYYDRTISLEGVVTSAWGVPLVPMHFYRIDDGTGELTVISQHGRTPARGARVRVTGKVAELAVVGGRSIGLHVQEHRLSVLRH